ncbi:SurA N-terminal domain-containing protein [Marinicella meishanensis]|uniref:SurA N-terminal domain-containing protein n=1 Tax=Marinicella meishanensis TaxID=2873263 RepID=UPI001CBDAF48|nr:SurA N-terminal domain-containing protein [Marinicella sp. NBU2979]
MLTWIRKKSTGLFMTIVMILLIAAFALWGVGDYFTQSSNDQLATVNGETITYTEFNRQFATQRQNMIAQYGQGMDPSVFDSPMMRRQYLEQMIDRELIKQIAQGNGYTVTAADLKRTIEEAPAFKDENGQFDKTLYAAFLSQTNQSAQLLQMKLADDQASAALNELFTTTAFITPFESRKMAHLNKQTRDFEYVTVSPADFMAQVTVSEEELQAHYDENSAQYMTEEQVAVNYIEIKAEDLAGEIVVTDAEALSYFEDNKAQYTTPEQRLTSHILVNKDGSEEEVLQELQDKLAAGEDFAELAKTYSQDPGSAEQGGDLGWVLPGDMVEAFNDALFAMEAGTVSEPVETQFGWHLIQLNEVRAEAEPVFEAVQADIVQALQASQSETVFLEKVTEVSEAALDAFSGLDQVAINTGFELKTSELFSRNGGADAVTANVEFVKAAFSPNVKEQLNNSDAIYLSDTHVAFIHINEIKDPEVRPLAEVKGSIEAQLKSDKAESAADEMANTLVELFEAGEQTLAEVAADYEKTAQNAEAVARVGSSLPFNLVKNVFELGRPAAGERQAHVLSGNGNDKVVVNLIAVNDVELDAVEDLAAESVQLNRNIRNNEQQLLLQALREAGSVTINEDLLNQASPF